MSVTIRKHPPARFADLAALATAGFLPGALIDFLEASVAARLNILVSGGAGAGKTTFMRVLARLIASDERVVTIEDQAELHLWRELPDCIALEGRPSNTEGRGAITIQMLVHEALRMSPDRIIIGEFRGGEALDLLDAMNTGQAAPTWLRPVEPATPMRTYESMAICCDGLIRSAFPSVDDTAGPERPSRVELSILARVDSELLGFASDARVLILNCDDLGMHEAVNAAIFDAIENGVATSCSLMAPCPGAADAIALLRERPYVPFGLHLTLIRDNQGYVWGPSSPKTKVPSLLDPNTGELFTDEPVNRDRLLAQARLDDVERELRAQLNAVVGAGLSPTHLDWHCLADGGRADIFDLGLVLAEEYGLAARVWLDDGRQKARALGKPVVDRAFLDSFTVDVDSKPETYERLLRALPSGLSEWAVHPALGTEDWQAIEPSGWRVRQSDHAFLTSDRAREVIAEERIQVIDYKLLQNAWRNLPDTTA